MAVYSVRPNRDHRFASERLSVYLDGMLSAREVARIERHLEQCETCRQDLVTLRSTLLLLRRAPLRPVPRSFVLPRSVQPQQASHRRWNLAFSFLQTATVVVATALIVVISGDALFSMGAIPAPSGPSYGAAPAPSPVTAMMQPQEEVVAQQEKARDVSAEAQALLAEQPSMEIEAEVQTIQPNQLAVESAQDQPISITQAAPVANPPVAEDRVAATAEINIGPLPRTAGAQPSAAAAAPVGGGGGAGGAGEAAGLGASGAPSDSAPVGGGGESRGFVAFPTARAPITPLPTPAAQAKQEAQPTLAPQPSPTVVLVTRNVTEETLLEAPAPAAPLLAEEPSSTQTPSLLWQLWRAARLASWGLAGVLCVLASGLLWANHKKRL